MRLAGVDVGDLVLVSKGRRHVTARSPGRRRLPAALPRRELAACVGARGDRPLAPRRGQASAPTTHIARRWRRSCRSRASSSLRPDRTRAGSPRRRATAGSRTSSTAQVHDLDGGGPSYLWSRENGSVVAGLVAIGATAAPGMDAALTVDRVGRDEELSIREGDLVEVTSVDRQLHDLPGFLATAGAPDGLRLPVAWSAAAPAGFAELGRVPLVRRWEGGPAPAAAAAAELEDDIEVRFGTGDFRVGDYWLIPARTVRLVYGATALAGTIDWPIDGGGVPQPQPPLGPVRHRTTLAQLDRSRLVDRGAGRRDSCRRRR